MLLGASVVDLIFLVSAIISSLFYITILALLIKNRKVAPFKHHFFKLFISVGVADLGAGLTAYVELAKQWGWLDWSPLFFHPYLGWFFQRFNSVSYIGFGMSQYLGVAALGANRFYNIESPQWTANNQLLALFLQWALPTATVIPHVSQKYIIFVANHSGITSLRASPHNDFNVPFGAFLTLSQLIVVISVAVLYCRIYARVRKLKHDFGLSEDKRSELKLALVGFILFVLMFAQQLVTVALIISMAVNSRSLFMLSIGLLYRLTSVFAFINPWLLIGCSKPTRDALREWFRINNHTPMAPDVIPMQPMFQKIAKPAVKPNESNVNVCEEL